MSTEVWALAGVVVGALLGGLAQIGADWLGGRREREQYVRDTRRTAYAALLAAETHSYNSMDIAKTMIGAKGSDEWKFRIVDATLEARTAQVELNTAVAHVALVAPKDTSNAASALSKAVAAATQDFDDAALMKGMVLARRSFLDLAKRDLGIKS